MAVDIHIYVQIMIESKSSLLKPKLPAVTIGHEACGTIAEVGERVVGWKIGEPVGFLVYYGACCKLPLL